MAGVIVAWAVTHALDLRSGYWAMITVCVVVQGNLGGTLDAGLTQFAGTVVGGVLGMAGVWLRAHHMLPDWTVLLLVLSPLALLSASDQHLRTGPVTALIVLLVTPTNGSPIDLALTRIGEIAIGSAIGIAVSILLLPGRARPALERAVTGALRAMGALAHDLLTTGAADEDLVRRIDAAIAGADAARDAWGRERAVHLTAAVPIDPLLRAVRRVRTDIFTLGRAMGTTEVRAGETAKALDGWFNAAADAVYDHAAVPPAPAAAETGGPADALDFCLAVLARDTADLADRIAAYAGRDRDAARVR